MMKPEHEGLHSHDDSIPTEHAASAHDMDAAVIGGRRRAIQLYRHFQPVSQQDTHCRADLQSERRGSGNFRHCQ
ncbi:hypothetical protein DESC_460047 [Desulfosarcina cetonica]|nr:hypothetical protein DESC_460047 [Desulfosarcina cetonica]